ncbi:hypothetical protein GY21_14600 [Cryobacterium roopkundense]|uniref:DUF4192 domain-containing protein n=1 Tax=Cryobacterium roopkundense TaxID=1001240 RepID=A0A099J3E8_9MICO|nr:DUF4192 domain-containing protein [Cryobacterium roopkundense]KGJ72565.1 hypothetical protein GY21_14600 [Cryobacterium roopkundense]MBB5640212.1 hypothetical protein [Cryobacterium roopkundense]
MQPTIVKTRKAHDFLALVPQLVGFRPERSMVLVAFRGNRTCGALRFNLPDPDAPTQVYKRIATTLVGVLCKIPGVDAVVPVAYTDESFSAVRGLPHENFVDCLVKRAEMSGFLVRDALCVAADAWGSYLDPNCPARGRTLDEITSSPVCEEIPAAHRLGLATVQSGAELPRVAPVVRNHVLQAYRRYQRLDLRDARQEALVQAVGEVLDPVDIAEEALTWSATEPDPADVARLLFVVQSPAYRDQVMVQFAFGREVGRQAYQVNQAYLHRRRSTGRSLDDLVAEEFESGENPEAWRISDLLLGQNEDRPDPLRIERAISLLKYVAASAPRRNRPAPLCMLSWLSWTLGRGSVAGLLVEQALAIDSTYPMATLLNTLLGTGTLPDWAFSVPTDDVQHEVVQSDEHPPGVPEK